MPAGSLKYVISFSLGYKGHFSVRSSITSPDFGKDDVFFPKLPEIRSPAIKSQVFTHRSYYARQTHIFEDLPDDPSPDNEK